MHCRQHGPHPPRISGNSPAHPPSIMSCRWVASSCKNRSSFLSLSLIRSLSLSLSRSLALSLSRSFSASLSVFISLFLSLFLSDCLSYLPLGFRFSIPSCASGGLADYSQVDSLRLRYKSVNLGAETCRLFSSCQFGFAVQIR